MQRNIDSGQGAPTFESELIELIAVAHVEDEEFVATFQPFEQISRCPDFIVQSFCHDRLRTVDVPLPSLAQITLESFAYAC